MRTATALVGDIALAEHLRAPLLQSAETYRHLGVAQDQRPSETSVALDLRLPYVTELNMHPELVRLRGEHRDEVTRLRAAIRRAISEELPGYARGYSASIAHRVVRDHVEPELAALARRMSDARVTLTRKMLTVAVGTAGVAVGLLAAAPLIVGAGVTALG